jgi:sensor histidine kinase regulating citrate/malate metabolism
MERAWLDAPGARYLADAHIRRHERRNALHTLQGLRELARHAEKQPELFAASTGVPLAEVGEIMKRVGDSLIRAQLVGKLLAASERGVELRLSPGSCLPNCLEGSGEVATVLGNLIDNAMDAVTKTGRTGPWVEVALHQERGVVELRVTDNGPGVAPHLRQWIFVRGASTKRSSPGRLRGIGLALVLTISGERGGSVAVTDREDGGAVFTVRMKAVAKRLLEPAGA